MRMACCLLAISLLPPIGQAAAPPVAKYTHNKIHDRDGIGKFYMGREIAHFMSHEAADWLERPERIKEERTDKLLKALPIKPGMTVVDLGAGSGYFSFPLAKLVGPKGKILAVDIQKEMLDLIHTRMKKRKVTNIEPILGTVSDPKLPEGKVDLILMVDVYHEFSHPYEMVEAMVRSLKVGGPWGHRCRSHARRRITTATLPCSPSPPRQARARKLSR